MCHYNLSHIDIQIDHLLFLYNQYTCVEVGVVIKLIVSKQH